MRNFRNFLPVLLAALIAISIWILPPRLWWGSGVNLLVNSSFENGDFNSCIAGPNCTDPQPLSSDGSTRMLCAGSQAISNWVVFKANPFGPQYCVTNKDIVAWITYPDEFGVSPEDGKRFLDLTGIQDKNSQDFGGVYQDITLGEGQKYHIGLYFGMSTKNPPFNLTLTTTVDDLACQAPSNCTIVNWSSPIGTVGLLNEWRQFNQYFTVPGTGGNPRNVRISVSAASLNGTGEYFGLDNIILDRSCMFGFIC